MKSLHISRLLTDEEARREVSPEEWAAAQQMQLPRRRQEWLTWHAMVRRVLGREVAISYNALGAPQVDTPHIYISVSHCNEGVAVSFAERRCAIDIESLTRNFERVAPRYLTTREALLSHDDAWKAVVWSAKETLYKYAAEEGLDFRDQLSIIAADTSRHRLRGRITTATRCEEVEMGYMVLRRAVVVFTL